MHKLDEDRKPVYLIANVAVLVAAAGSFLLLSRWPDILVGGLISSLFLPAAAPPVPAGP